MRQELSMIIIASFFFTGWSCWGYPDDGSKTHIAVLLSTTFEESNVFTLSGWWVAEPVLTSFVIGIKETPIPSSLFAVRLQRDTVNLLVPGLTTTIIAKSADGSSNYRIALWTKGKGTLLVQQRTPDGQRGETFYINHTVWSNPIYTLFTSRPTADTLTLTFRPSDIDSISFLMIDNIYITYRQLD